MIAFVGGFVKPIQPPIQSNNMVLFKRVLRESGRQLACWRLLHAEFNIPRTKPAIYLASYGP